MKKIFLMFMSLSMFLVASAFCASAQITERLTVNIPFDFIVRDKTFPAGKYIVAPVNSNMEETLEIRDLRGKSVVIFLGEDATASTAPDQSELIFKRIGDRYFLSEIFEQGNTIGMELEKTRLEKRLEKDGAMAERQSITVYEQNGTKAGN